VRRLRRRVARGGGRPGGALRARLARLRRRALRPGACAAPRPRPAAAAGSRAPPPSRRPAPAQARPFNAGLSEAERYKGDPARYTGDAAASAALRQGDLFRECLFARAAGAAHAGGTLARYARVRIAPPSFLESSANNIGILVSTAPVVIILQDDQIMTTAGWNAALARPLLQFADAFSASMRCAHGWPSGGGMAGAKCGNPMLPQEGDACTYEVRDSCNRGPLALNRSRALELGLLDETLSCGGALWGGLEDEHMLNLRAFREHGWVAGLVAVHYTEEKCCGSQPADRAARDAAQAQYLQWCHARRDAGAPARAGEVDPRSAVAPHDSTRRLRDCAPA
jgi:hypothetical protein